MIDPDLESRAVDQFHYFYRKRDPSDLKWKLLDPAPVARMDAASAQIDHELFVFGGFLHHGDVVTTLNIFNMKNDQWGENIDLPKDMAQTHIGIASEDRGFIYLISGQLGGNCRPATKRCFVFNIRERAFLSFPDLPVPRYAAAVQIWNGRLHVLGGSGEDRHTPEVDHWSIAIENGCALEDHWRNEPPISKGGPHRACVVMNDCLYVFGGQLGDWVACKDDPEFKCDPLKVCETMYPDVYMLEAGSKEWIRKADMPVQSSHTEYSVIQSDHKLAIVGGQVDRDRQNGRYTLTDVIQVYEADKDSWEIVGSLPYRVKEGAVCFYNGNIYITGGQCDKGKHDPSTADQFERATWKANFSLEL